MRDRAVLDLRIMQHAMDALETIKSDVSYHSITSQLVLCVVLYTQMHDHPTLLLH